MLPEYVRFLIEAAHQAPSPDNSQPWEFSWSGEELRIQLSKNRCNAVVFGKGHPAIALTLGAILENIYQAASAAGIDIKWRLDSGDEIDSPAKISIEKISCPNSPLPDLRKHPVFNRHTNRHPFKKTTLPENLIDHLRSMTEGSSFLRVFDNHRQIKELSGLINHASKIRFRMKELHEWLASSLRFTPDQVDRGDGLDVKTIHLPPGGAQLLKATKEWRRMDLLNRIGAFRLFAAIEAGLFRKTGAVIAVVMNNPENDTLSAGRLMERAWIMLNENGIAVQPYFVLTDQLYRLSKRIIPSHLEKQASKLREEAGGLLSSDGEEILMLLRAGYPTKEPILSRRLNWTDIVTISPNAHTNKPNQPAP